MSKSRALSKQDCIALRDQLTELGYGQAEAETDELFALRLYPVTEHLRALDTKVVLVVGPRGSGKSALFRAFFAENRIWLTPSGTGCAAPRRSALTPTHPSGGQHIRHTLTFPIVRH